MSITVLVTTEYFHTKEFPTDWQVVYNPYGRKLTEEEIGALIRQYRPIGIIAGIEPLTRRVMEQAEGLKAISRVGIGLDSVDLQAAGELGIRVANTPDAPTVSVAEFTLGLMLGLARQIHTMDGELRAGRWKSFGGMLLKGKTVGIVGCGRIGSAVANLVKAFGCKPVGYDPYLQRHDVIDMMTLDELLKASDIVTLHIPYTPQSRHMIGAEQFALMKSGALLINAARGGIVDEDALAEALAAGRIAGAAMDCFEQEPYSGRLAGMQNVLLTPHAGSGATEARIAMERDAIRNLIGLL